MSGAMQIPPLRRAPVRSEESKIVQRLRPRTTGFRERRKTPFRRGVSSRTIAFALNPDGDRLPPRPAPVLPHSCK